MLPTIRQIGVALLLISGLTVPSSCSRPTSEDATPSPVGEPARPHAAGAGETLPVSDAASSTVGGVVTADSSETPQHRAEAAPPADSFRPPDLRPRHDADVAASQGIRLYESRRLKLFTDVDPAVAETLPPLLDALFDEWESYFGTLPPARDGSDYQLTGYLMRDQQAFRDAGMLPAALPGFAHGKHDGQQFWMNDQEHSYYRRHLLLHEATHCFMQSMGGTTEDVPLWYLEGMAELFATHRLDQDGVPTFRVVPDQPDEFVGFGRMELVAKDVRDGHAFTLPQLTSLNFEEFQSRPSAYAWSWSACLLADRHPRYHSLFQELGRRYATEGFAVVRGELLDRVTADFVVEWNLLTRSLDYGHDVAATAISLEPGRPLADSELLEVEIAADRGWQSSGVAVTPGTTYLVEAAGRITLAEEPRPWISEADGITIRYASGQPIGRMLGLIIGDAPETPTGRRFVGDVIPLGRQAELSPAAAGTLYLRVNDFDSELADNAGRFQVRITRSGPSQEP